MKHRNEMVMKDSKSLMKYLRHSYEKVLGLNEIS